MVATLALKDAANSPDKKRPKKAEEKDDPMVGADGGGALAKGPPAAAPASGGDGTKAPKGRAKGGGSGRGPQAALSTKELTSMMGDLTRLVLTHDDAIAHLEAIQYRTLLLPEDSELAKVCRAEGAAYHERATAAEAAGSGEAKNSNLGPPHVYIATAAISHMATSSTPELEQIEGHKQTFDQLKELSVALQQATTEQAAALIPYWRVNKTHDDVWRIRYSVTHSAHQLSINWYLVNAEQGKVKVGRAPKGRMARELQKRLK